MLLTGRYLDLSWPISKIWKYLEIGGTASPITSTHCIQGECLIIEQSYVRQTSLQKVNFISVVLLE
jgi:hypothetical protein